MHAANAVERFARNVANHQCACPGDVEVTIKDNAAKVRILCRISAGVCAVLFAGLVVLVNCKSYLPEVFRTDGAVTGVFIWLVASACVTFTLYTVGVILSRLAAAAYRSRMNATTLFAASAEEVKAFSKNVDSKVSVWRMAQSGRYNKVPKDEASES
jgi:hypothetical protein